VPPEGGKGEPTFWAPIQNDGTSSKKQTFEDPSTNGDAAATASANCAKQVYKMSNGSTFPPASATDSWSGVTSDTKEKTYPLCGIAYELSLTNFSAYPATTPGEEITDANFLSFILNAKAGGGQTAIEEHDYETLPTKLDRESLDAVALMGFY
jgi:hypothetical protein